MKSYQYYTLLFLIIATGAAARFFHFDVTIGSDDQRYVIAARQMIGDTSIKLTPEYYTRVGWRGALALWGKVFGLTLESTAVLMFLLASLSTFLVARIGKILFGPWASLAAAALHASCPVNVVFDVVTLADSLAVPLMLFSLYLFFQFSERRTWWLLAAAGVCAGLLFSIKDYFCLIVLPYGFYCLLSPEGPRKKMAWVSALGLSFSLGLLVNFLLQYHETGNALTGIRAYSATIPRMNSLLKETNGPRQLLQFNYVKWLLEDTGAANVCLYLLGFLFLFVRAKSRADCRVLFLGLLLFSIFLCAMPVSFHPLRFVAQQSRYVMVVIPFLALGAGAALATLFESCKDHGLRWCSVVVLALICLFNYWMPNTVMVYNRPAYTALKKCLRHSRELGFSHLILPCYHDQIVPDSFYRRGVLIDFAKYDSPVPHCAGILGKIGDVSSYVAEKNAAFFITPPVLYAEDSQEVSALLTKEGFVPQWVCIPDTSLGIWLDRFGVKPDSRLVRWLDRLAIKNVKTTRPVGLLFVKAKP